MGGGAPAAEVFLLPHPESIAAPRNTAMELQADIKSLRIGLAVTLAGHAFMNLPNTP
jgi:hypothetical protein